MVYELQYVRFANGTYLDNTSCGFYLWSSLYEGTKCYLLVPIWCQFVMNQKKGKKWWLGCIYRLWCLFASSKKVPYEQWWISCKTMFIYCWGSHPMFGVATSCCVGLFASTHCKCVLSLALIDYQNNIFLVMILFFQYCGKSLCSYASTILHPFLAKAFFFFF